MARPKVPLISRRSVIRVGLDIVRPTESTR